MNKQFKFTYINTIIYVLLAPLMIFGTSAATRRGTAILHETEIEILLRHSRHIIPYRRIRKTWYYTFRQNRGLIIKTGLFKRLDIKDAGHGLFPVYTALKKKI